MIKSKLEIKNYRIIEPESIELVPDDDENNFYELQINGCSSIGMTKENVEEFIKYLQIMIS